MLENTFLITFFINFDFTSFKGGETMRVKVRSV